MSQEQQVDIIIDYFCEYCQITKLELLAWDKDDQHRYSPRITQLGVLVSVLRDKGLSYYQIGTALHRDPKGVKLRVQDNDMHSAKIKFIRWLLCKREINLNVTSDFLWNDKKF